MNNQNECSACQRKYRVLWEQREGHGDPGHVTQDLLAGATEYVFFGPSSVLKIGKSHVKI